MKPEIIIRLPNGGSLRCGPGTDYEWGGYLRIHDEQGNEILHWESTEWAEDPEAVIGAVFAAAATPLAILKENRELVDGAWIHSPN